jgi:multidrug resistance efflux pump
MFNKVHATFAGTVDELLLQGGDGTIVQKGQPLFRVTPDDKVIEETPAARAARLRESTRRYLDAIVR